MWELIATCLSPSWFGSRGQMGREEGVAWGDKRHEESEMKNTAGKGEKRDKE